MSARPGYRKFQFTEADLQRMEQLYAAGLSTGEIAQQFGCLMGSVWKRLQKRGVQLRSFKWRRPRVTQHSHGYVLIAGQYEHRIVAEQMLGRPLRPGECVHHKNHDVADNRPENLEVFASHSDHMKEHDFRAWTPAAERAMLTLRGAGVTCAEIARILGCTRFAVNNRVKRLRERGVIEQSARARRREATHCKYGHPLVEGNIYYFKGRGRVCRTCALTRLRERRAARRAAA